MEEGGVLKLFWLDEARQTTSHHCLRQNPVKPREEIKLKTRKTLLALASTLTVALTAIAPHANADNVNIGDIVGDQATTGDIVSYGLGPRAQRYSPLATINKDNIKNLFPVWSFCHLSKMA